MVGTIRIRWVRGILTENGKEKAGPGDIITVDHFRAEEFVGQGKAEYVEKRR